MFVEKTQSLFINPAKVLFVSYEKIASIFEVLVILVNELIVDYP